MTPLAALSSAWSIATSRLGMVLIAFAVGYWQGDGRAVSRAQMARVVAEREAAYAALEIATADALVQQGLADQARRDAVRRQKELEAFLSTEIMSSDDAPSTLSSQVPPPRPPICPICRDRVDDDAQLERLRDLAR